MSTENASLSCSIDVVGSLNIDLVTVTPRVPSRGETLTATSFSTGFGGKGANQAVACARLLRLAPQAQPEHGVTVRMLGATGDDQFGVDFRNHLEREGVDIAALKTKDALSTGTAVILVEQDSGDNRILFTPGANGAVSTEDIHLDGKAGDFVIFQLEIPLPVVVETVQKAKQRKNTVVFNPAPAVPLPDEVFDGLDHLILNESEAAILSGIAEDKLGSNFAGVTESFHNRGVRNVVLTLGSKGVFWSRRDPVTKATENSHVPAHKVRVVDTTAAGDTFVGAYAVWLAGHSANDTAGAVRFANLAASLSVQKAGAQSAIPFLQEVNEQMSGKSS